MRLCILRVAHLRTCPWVLPRRSPAVADHGIILDNPCRGQSLFSTRRLRPGFALTRGAIWPSCQISEELSGRGLSRFHDLRDSFHAICALRLQQRAPGSRAVVTRGYLRPGWQRSKTEPPKREPPSCSSCSSLARRPRRKRRGSKSPTRSCLSMGASRTTAGWRGATPLAHARVAFRDHNTAHSTHRATAPSPVPHRLVRQRCTFLPCYFPPLRGDPLLTAYINATHRVSSPSQVHPNISGGDHAGPSPTR